MRPTSYVYAGRAGRILTFSVFLFLTVVPGAGAQPTDVSQLSLEELANLEVTSVAKQPRRLSDSAAAVFVITQQDIRRSGATTFAEVLRMVPGVHVARIDGNKWAIGIRGFSDRFANKLLVLVDGRSIYTPLFGGVMWELQDTLLDDIERIEVIRGPGATLWGANAVSGVINVITRSAQKTTGLHVSSSVGSTDRWSGEVRYGGELGSKAAFRAFTKYYTRDSLNRSSAGMPAYDQSQSTRVGGRLDVFPSATDTVTVSTETFAGDFGQLSASPENLTWPTPIQRAKIGASGGFVLGSWERVLSTSSRFVLQAYFDHGRREDVVLNEHRDAIDIDFQHQFKPSARHTLVWGADLRSWDDNITNTTSNLKFDPPARRTNLASAFAQDDIMLFGEAVRLTLGAKVERHAFTKAALLPNVRALWVHRSQSLWGAVSRAIRTPSRAERDMLFHPVILPAGTLASDAPMAVVELQGTAGLDNEATISLEAGYRYRLGQTLSFDVAVFSSRYEDSIEAYAREPFVAFEPLRLVLPYGFTNRPGARTRGAEVSADWLASDRLRIVGTWSEFGSRAGQPQSVSELFSSRGLTFPRHLGSLRVLATLPGGLEFSPAYYYASAQGDDIEQLSSADATLNWPVSKHLDVMLAAHNLFDRRAPEFRASLDGALASEGQRRVLLRTTVRF